MTDEHEQAIALLKVTRENQNSLAAELSDFKDRYEEVLSLLHETQEQLRQQRKKVQPMVRGGLPPHLSHIMPHIATAAGLTQHDSLQSELLQTSLYSDFSLDSGIGDNRVLVMFHVNKKINKIEFTICSIMCMDFLGLLSRKCLKPLSVQHVHKLPD